MRLYTIGFTQKSAEQFFGLIKAHDIRLLVDIRLNNASQLAGFTKGGDLAYFLKELCGCEYRHATEFTPTKELMESYRQKTISDEDFRDRYAALMAERGSCKTFAQRYGEFERACLLCSEPEAKHCHRGVLADLLQKEQKALEIVHI